MQIITTDQKGFTLIEIIVVVAILTVIISFGMTVDFSSFTSSNFQNEESKIIALLEKARSRSMSNMFERAHGVCYLAPDYVIFRDGTCDKSATDETIPANTGIASNPLTVFPAVVFEQLTGNTTSATDIVIHITDGVKVADIKINN